MQSAGKLIDPPETELDSSPKWNGMTKLVVAISLTLIGIGLISSFQSLIGPLLIAFILSYLLYPVASWMRDRLKISWRVAVGIIFLVILLLLFGLLTWGGVTLAQQILSLVNVLETAVKGLPGFLAELNSKPIMIGPLLIDLRQLDLSVIGTQVLGVVQPLFSQVGNLVGTFASTAVLFIGWAIFILWIVYFILSETGGVPGQIITLKIPGYQGDIKRMSIALNWIWNTFLRRQFLIISLYVFNYALILGVLQVHFFFGLAIMAGLARFIPYIGAMIVWSTFALVSFIQNDPAFGLSTTTYVLLVAGIVVGVDQFMDNLIVPKLMSNALRVHPAVVMVVAIIAFNYVGVIGLVLAAPVFATIKLLMRYIARKMFDLDPWVGVPQDQSAPSPPPVLLKMKSLFLFLLSRVKNTVR